jgi:hypothetical protein
LLRVSILDLNTTAMGFGDAACDGMPNFYCSPRTGTDQQNVGSQKRKTRQVSQALLA